LYSVASPDSMPLMKLFLSNIFLFTMIDNYSSPAKLELELNKIQG
jgi:hypothetical protein